MGRRRRNEVWVLCMGHEKWFCQKRSVLILLISEVHDSGMRNRSLVTFFLALMSRDIHTRSSPTRVLLIVDGSTPKFSTLP